METPNLPACPEQDEGDAFTSTTAALTVAQRPKHKPLVLGPAPAETHLMPSVASPAPRPSLHRSTTDTNLPSPLAVTEASESNAFALSPPATPPSASIRLRRVVQYSNILPPDDLNVHTLRTVDDGAVEVEAQTLSTQDSRPASDALLTSGLAGSRLTLSNDIPTPPADLLESVWPIVGCSGEVEGDSLASLESAKEARISLETAGGDVLAGSTGTQGQETDSAFVSSAAPTWADILAQKMAFDKGHIVVLSQAFPSPDNTSNAIHRLLAAWHKLRQPAAPSISLKYAVPMHFSLNRLPGSSSTTPQENPTSDYFSSKVITSAVPSSDQQPGAMAIADSLNLTVVERFIPPTTSSQVNSMFSSEPQGYLATRLQELKRQNGMLVLIHPTHVGAVKFAQDCLGKTLDPTLRSITVVYDLMSRFCDTIGTLDSLDAVPSFTQMRENMTRLCEKLSASRESMAKSGHSPHPEYSVVHASTALERLTSDIWAKLWTEQEKQRIKKAVHKYFRDAKRSVKDDHQAEVPQSTLVNEILSGVANKAGEVGASAEIELGLFIIQKSCRE